ALTVGMFFILPMTFQPTQDEDQVSVNVEMVPGTTLEQTDRVVHQVAERLRHEPNVENLYERAGVGNGRVLVIFKEK
ncbi:efflux RND transporter permease subunit, partial [Klebsiella aerogenes]